MLSAMVLLVMMTAIFWPAYQVTRPAILARSPAPRPSATSPAPEEPAMLVSRLDDYVQQGLVDLRIMLVQAARRRQG
ncbi:hypothetical protein [Nocardioides marmoribigeumensis]|uniref:Uncharacterized protein n=1 Tax=Nocardioides marmoribigeumensis TaxID=433649 RepID=A0ABU2BUA8_9ACTN|nr:hypothetical protein [Nocardioides marmoribigeumensis]MDR7362214.1 hypothetical protein [Nocardioides marmoribigeumensis]